MSKVRALAIDVLRLCGGRSNEAMTLRLRLVTSARAAVSIVDIVACR
jgi:hypothetical protein